MRLYKQTARRQFTFRRAVADYAEAQKAFATRITRVNRRSRRLFYVGTLIVLKTIKI